MGNHEEGTVQKCCRGVEAGAQGRTVPYLCIEGGSASKLHEGDLGLLESAETSETVIVQNLE